MNSQLTTIPASPAAAQAFGPGTVLRDTYRILKAIGAGGMGRVYAAEHRRLPGLFAVKALHADMIDNEAAVARFAVEAHVMACLRHPNIVQVIDYNVTEGGVPYLVMEHVDGQNLGDCLRAGETMPPTRVARIIEQAARGLDVAHRRGIVHRDLKPENVMLVTEINGQGVQEDMVKVLDFGISKTPSESRFTAEETLLGTPQFMAPEQARGRNDEVDHRTDQFALASIAYTLLAGVEPFRGPNPVSVLYQVVHEPAMALSQHVSWASAEVDAVIRRGMAKERDDRFANVLEFAQALTQAVANDLRASAARPTLAALPAVRPVVQSFVRPSVRWAAGAAVVAPIPLVRRKQPVEVVDDAWPFARAV